MTALVLAAARTLAQTEESASWFDFKTILLLALAATLFFVTYKLMGMHRRLEALETNPPFPKDSGPQRAEKPSISPQTVAAISAAIHTTLNARHKILSISNLRFDQQAWSVEGRRQVFHSHKVR